jgi:hypothetical protein
MECVAATRRARLLGTQMFAGSPAIESLETTQGESRMSRLPSIEKTAVRYLGLLAGVVTATATASPRDIESVVSPPSTVSSALEEKKSAYRRTRVDFSGLRDGSHRDTSKQVTLPLPEGGDTTFTLSDSGVLPPELAERYPDILSMKGIDAYGRLLRLDTSAKGVRAIVFDEAGTWRVQPANAADRGSRSNGEYVIFREGARPASARVSSEPTWSGLLAKSTAQSNGHKASAGHREYRLAVAATSAYTRYFGGSVGDGLASVVETINRVNAVFERDLGIHLTLVKNNDKIIFADPAEDPYIPPVGNDDFDFTRAQNIKVLSRVIGKGEFDIGHLFEVSEGGGATNSTVCDDDKKADAHTGLIPDSTGTPGSNQQFIITVMHELAHQFGADHTFNGCQRDSDAGFEPGSGSTIMSYAGECFLADKWPLELNPLHNLQGIQDEYFHAKSISHVRAFVAGPGSACGLERGGQGEAPIIVNSQDKMSAFIPARTPFFLDAYAETRNRAQATYAWEQVDTGAEQREDEALSDKGTGPVFRSYPPTPVGVRIFPKLEAVLGDERLDKGEAYPTTTRELNFSLTVRDNLGDHASASSATRVVRVVDTGQAFAVRSPLAGVNWEGGSRRAVTWNVAGTAGSPIACTSVRIDLSPDGGYSYLPQPLAVSTPNSGHAYIDVPTLDRELHSARVRVTCNDHLFFAVSPGNFSIVK